MALYPLGRPLHSHRSMCHDSSSSDYTRPRFVLRLLVIGSSDTSGSSLADPSQAWPWLVADRLSNITGEAVDVVNLPVVPVGPKAVPRVEKALAENQPDLVVFSFGAYHFIVATVGQRVRRRYGERAYRAFRKLELLFERRTARLDSPSRLNYAGRWLARRVIGAEPMSTRDEVTAIHLEIMRQLAQREGVIVVIQLAPPLGESLERENRGANQKLAEYRTYMNGVGRNHHFLIADCVPGFESARGSRHSDGVHKSASGHLIQADAVMSALLNPPSPLAASPRKAEPAARPP